MATLTKFLIAFSLVALAGTATAQIVPSGPFTGQRQETFETQNTPFPFSTCVFGRVFSSTADLCDPSGNAILITGGWSYFCSINPHAGIKLCGSAGGPAIWTFDSPATRFGGFFGTNSGTSDATIEFRDVGGNLIASFLASIPANCGWTWQGWQVTGGPLIKSVKIIGLNGFNGGGFIDMDDMEVDFACAPSTTYCSPKVNSLGCSPLISSTGTSSASALSGFVIKASPEINNKPGLLLYGNNGPAAAPFFGGLRCVGLPVHRSIPLSSHGDLPPNNCSGAYSLDMNSFAAGGLGGTPQAFLTSAGTVVDCQYWGRDNGFSPPNNASLSDGLEYTVCP